MKSWSKFYILLAFLSALSLAIYLAVSFGVYRMGFPLDDAWIHQTYARNLIREREWAFLPGQPSAGSTAPLWSLLLAAGYVLHLGPYVWSYLLGWLMLLAIALVGVWTFRGLCPDRSKWAVWAGLFLIFEYHLVWAAGSGMETLLSALLALIVVTDVAHGSPHWFRLGLLIGLSVWVRPDGVTLFGPAAVGLYFAPANWKERFWAAGRMLLGMALLVLPYLAFNEALAGTWLPNTFFAKQAEYAIHRQIPLLKRLVAQISLPLIGAGALLLPGFIVFLVQAIRQRKWMWLAGAAWVVGYLVLYALRLPVTYQHGRYVIPVMPVYFLWSLAGLASLIQVKAPALWKRILAKAWPLSLGLVLMFFWLIGARSYAYDVAVIETEMVDTAYWVAANTEPDALIAAHDIGALGYFGERQLIDLAGLVSPEVIPFIRDEARLQEFMDEQGAEYLVTFPGWYPELVTHGHMIYTSGAGFSPVLGGENMAVYAWGAR